MKRARNIKLKPEMTEDELDTKIEQSAQGYELLGDPDTADEVIDMSPAEFLEFVDREDVKIVNPSKDEKKKRKRKKPSALCIAKKKAEIFRNDNKQLERRLRKIRHIIEEFD